MSAPSMPNTPSPLRSERKPSLAVSLAIFVVATTVMAFLRLGLYPKQVIALTYGLPLLLCLWHRDRRLLWSMVATFIGMAAAKTFWLLPDPNPKDLAELAQWLMQVANVVVIGGAVHGIINLTERLQRKNARLEAANEALAAREEEIRQQNEELQAQSEELAQQNEELQQQGEELAQQNEELEEQSEELQAQAEELQTANQELNHRESMLQTILASLRGATDEAQAMKQICQALVQLAGESAAAAAVVEQVGEQLVVRTQAGAEKLRQHQWPFASSFAAVVMAHGRTAFVDDIAARPDLIIPEPQRRVFCSLLATPLRVNGKPVGAVEVYSLQPQQWTNQQFRIIEWVAAQCSKLLETMRLQDSLRRNEAQIRTIVENLAEGLVVSDLNGKLLHWNRAALEMHGFASLEECQRRLAELADTFELSGMDGAVWPVEQWPPARILRGETLRNFEARVRRLQGDWQRVFNYGGSLVRDAHGQPLMAVVTVTDITERKRAEFRTDLLADAAGQLLVTDSPQSVVDRLCEKALKVLDCQAFFNFLVDEQAGRLRLNACGGIPKEEARKIEWLDYGTAICGYAAQEACRIVAEDILHTGDPRTDLAKSYGIQAYACHPLMVQERVLGTLSFGARNRTRFSEDDLALMKSVADLVAIALERERTQAELRRMNSELEERVRERTARLQEMVDELEHFSYTITHDMRAPLRAMQGFAGMMDELCGPCLEQEKKDCLRRISNSAARMDRLITDALSYSKAVKEEPELTPVDANALLRGIVESYPALQPPKAKIEIEGHLPLVLGNEAGLTQCFSNLLGNAVKFVKPGQVPQIRIWAEKKVASERISESVSEKTGERKAPSLTHSFTDSLTGSCVRLWFEDNGIGIPRQMQTRIFQMFQRASKDHEGTGIGLALVRKVTERMGGRVGVESEPGKGSRFWLELRCAGETASRTPIINHQSPVTNCCFEVKTKPSQ